MRHAAVRDIPKEHKAGWPRFLVLPEWADDRALGNDGPSKILWEIRFEGMCGNKSEGLFIWKIPGWRDDWPEVSQRLARRAGGYGLTCVYIYEKWAPCTQDMYDWLNEINGEKDAAA